MTDHTYAYRTVRSEILKDWDNSYATRKIRHCTQKFKLVDSVAVLKTCDYIFYIHAN